MQILRKNQDLNLVLNHETDFQTNLGWQENLAQLEDEILGDIINPAENYETVRFIHEPYDSTNNLAENVVEQTDIWFYFYFLNNGTYNNGLDYNRVGITTRENAKMLRQSTESFFRLEFFKTPHILDENGDIVGYEAPNRINRKLVFAKNLSLPLGEKVFYTGENFNEYIHVPVFMGSNYKNKENMYFFWFQDESVLTETTLSGTTTGNTFFMTAKFFNASDGSIVDFTNDAFSTSYSTTGITESTDMYYQVDINKLDYSYKVYLFDGDKSTDRYGRTCLPIQFYERGGGTFTKPTYDCTSFVPPPTPAPSQTPAPTISLTPTPTPTPTPAGNGGGNGGTNPETGYYLLLQPCTEAPGTYTGWTVNTYTQSQIMVGQLFESAGNTFYQVINYQTQTPSPAGIIEGTKSFTYTSCSQVPNHYVPPIPDPGVSILIHTGATFSTTTEPCGMYESAIAGQSKLLYLDSHNIPITGDYIYNTAACNDADKFVGNSNLYVALAGGSKYVFRIGGLGYVSEVTKC